jgi:integrase
MRKRKQAGSIVVIGNTYFIRYWQRSNVGGEIVRKRCSRRLGEVPRGYRSKHPPDSISKAAEDVMREISESPITADRLISLSQFAETVFLPWVEEHLRPSTYRGYKFVWECHLKPGSSRYRGCLRDVRTHDVQNWLDQIDRLSPRQLHRNTLSRCKSTLSGLFKLAKRLGFFDGINPVADTAISPHAIPAEETHAYSLEEIHSILAVLPEPASTAFAIAAFTGLRHGEIAGLEWADLHDDQLWVARSVWNGTVNAPKTRKSAAPVPIIKQLGDRLEMHRLRSLKQAKERLKGAADELANPTGPIFANSVGGRLNLNNMLAREILPALNRCVRCGVSEGKPHLKQDHDYERDASIPEWRGWHACRRGLASNLNRLGVDDSIIQRMLRHSNVNVTQTFYIKSTGDEVRVAMEKIEQDYAAKTAVRISRDSDRTLNQHSGAMPESVN